MTNLEQEAIRILRNGEPLPVDIYINLNNSGINPDVLINHFLEGGEEEEDEGVQIETFNNINQLIKENQNE
jgi:hypothetical protein